MMVCAIYRSPKKEGMYLFVDKKDGLDKMPESLRPIFGEPQFAMTLMLKADRKLARADKDEVEQSIREKGYYLQMPPSTEELYNRGDKFKNDTNYKL